MRKKKLKKLSLKAETVKNLVSEEQMQQAAGGTVFTGFVSCGINASCYSCLYTGCQTVCWRCIVV